MGQGLRWLPERVAQESASPNVHGTSVFLFRYLRHEIRFDERFHRPGICQVGGLISVQLFEGRGFLALCGQQVWQRGPTCPRISSSPQCSPHFKAFCCWGSCLKRCCSSRFVKWVCLKIWNPQNAAFPLRVPLKRTQRGSLKK